MTHQLSESSTLRSVSCNYLRSAISSNGTEIAVVVDKFVGIFVCIDFNRPVYKLPIHTESGTGSGTKAGIGSGTTVIVHDVAWSPCHVGKGRWLAVATSEGKVDVWDVPETNTNKPVSRPQLLHSLAVSSMLVSSNSSPAIIKSIVWHPCALPTLVVFFINHSTITAVLPRRQRDTEITTLTPASQNDSSKVLTSNTRTAFTIGAVASSIPPSTTATSSSGSSSSGSSIGSLKRIYTLNKNTGQLCVFEDPLRDISRHVLVDTIVHGGGGGGGGRSVMKSAEEKDGAVKSVGIGMLGEHYEAQVPLLPRDFFINPLIPPLLFPFFHYQYYILLCDL